MDTDRESNSGLVWKLIAAGAASTTVIAVFVNVIISFSDMRSTVRDIQGKIQVFDDKVNACRASDANMEARLKEIDLGGSRELIATKATVKKLEEELNRLNVAVDRLNESLLSHNDEMIKLYSGKPPHKH